MSQPAYNPETLTNIPEPVRVRCYDMNGSAATALHVLETHYQLEEPKPAKEDNLAAVTDINEYREDKAAKSMPKEAVAVQASQSAEDNGDELAHLRELRRLNQLAHDQATPADQQQIERGLIPA